MIEGLGRFFWSTSPLLAWKLSLWWGKFSMFYSAFNDELINQRRANKPSVLLEPETADVLNISCYNLLYLWTLTRELTKTTVVPGNKSIFSWTGDALKCHQTLEEPSDATLVECDQFFDCCGTATQEGLEMTLHAHFYSTPKTIFPHSIFSRKNRVL